MPAKDKYGLTMKQREFCENYLLTENGVQSYLKAYGCSWSAASQSSYQLLKKPQITAYLEMRQEAVHKEMAQKYDVSVERIYKELARQWIGTVCHQGHAKFDILHVRFFGYRLFQCECQGLANLTARMERARATGRRRSRT